MGITTDNWKIQFEVLLKIETADSPFGAARCFDEEERAALSEEIPYGRFASPEEAAAFCYQITESPEYLTGQIIRFDGGWI